MLPAVAGLWDDGGAGDDPHLDPILAFGRAQVLIFRQTAAGEAAALPGLLPELVYLAVAPFAGHREALDQVRLAETEVLPEHSPSR